MVQQQQTDFDQGKSYKMFGISYKCWIGSTKFVSILKMSLPLAEKPCTVCCVAVTIISLVGSATNTKEKTMMLKG